MKLNLKKQQNKGLIGGFILSLIFLGIGVLFIFLYFSVAHGLKSAEQLYKEGKIYGSENFKVNDDPYAIKVTDLFWFYEAEEYDDYNHFIVEHDNGYVYMYAPYNDPTIQDIYERSESGELADDPAYLKVRSYYWEDPEDIDFIDELNDGISDPAVLISNVSYVNYDPYDFTDSDSDRYFFLVIGGIFAAVGIAILIGAFVGVSKGQKAYRDLIREYPEIENNDQLILTNGYYDDRLRVAVYRNHVISVFRKLMIVDLREIKSYNTFIQNSYYSGIRTGQFYFINAILKTNKSVKLPVKTYKKETEGRLEDIYTRISASLQAIYNNATDVPQNQSPFTGYKTPQNQGATVSGDNVGYSMENLESQKHFAPSESAASEPVNPVPQQDTSAQTGNMSTSGIEQTGGNHVEQNANSHLSDLYAHTETGTSPSEKDASNDRLPSNDITGDL